jgi:hypothetical protein
MRTGRIEANLVSLNEEYRLPYIAELVERKVHGAEKGTLQTPEMDYHRGEYQRLLAKLERVAAESTLPEAPTCREALNDLLIRVRLNA